MVAISDEMKLAILEKIGKIVKRKTIRLAPIDMGQLRASIDYKIEGTKKVIIFTDIEYAEDMEFGRPPEPLSDTEKEDLKGWAKRHDIPAYAVIRKIETKGIKVGTVKSPMKMPNSTYRPFMRPALFQSIPEIKTAIKEMK
jgi:hypothetical protein